MSGATPHIIILQRQDLQKLHEPIARDTVQQLKFDWKNAHCMGMLENARHFAVSVCESLF